MTNKKSEITSSVKKNKKEKRSAVANNNNKKKSISSKKKEELLKSQTSITEKPSSTEKSDKGKTKLALERSKKPKPRTKLTSKNSQIKETHLVTGASGYLGTLLVEKLLAEGFNVIGVDLEEFIPIEPLTQTYKERFKFVKADASNYVIMLEVTKNVDVVHHLVAQVPLNRPSKEFKIANEITPLITAKAASYNKVKKMVLISSSAVYGLPYHSPLDEEAPPYPFEPYGRSKLTGEINATRTLKNTSTDLVIIRPRTIISAHRLGIFDTLFNFISENRNIYLIGRSNHPLQFIHADDLIEAILILSKKGTGIYAIGTNKYTTLENDLNHLIKRVNSKSKIKHLPKLITINILALLYKLHLSPLSPWHYKGYANRFDITTLKAQNLGWEPKYSNIDMLEEAYNSYLKDKNTSNSIHSKKLNQKIIKIIRKLS